MSVEIKESVDMQKDPARTVFTYFNNRTNTRMCGCIECQKTFKPTPNSFEQDCPDCGGKSLRSSETTILKSDPEKKNVCQYIAVVKSHKRKDVYKDDVVAETSDIVDYDTFMVYQSNRMHKESYTKTIRFDVEDAKIENTIVNTRDNTLVANYEMTDAFKYPTTDRNNPNVSPHGISEAEEYAIKKYSDTPQNKYLPYLTMSAAGGSRWDDFGKCGKCEQSMKLVADRFGVDVGKYGAEYGVTDFCIRYPGLRDMVLDSVNQNIFYQNISESDAPAFRRAAISECMKTLSTMDDKLCADLRKQKTAQQCDAYLKSVVFGKNAQGEVDANSPMSKIDTHSAEFEGLGMPKKLKKSFNKNPLGTANFVYTVVGKIGFRDPNHLYRMMDDMQNEKTDPPFMSRHSNSPYVNDTIAPIQTKEAIRFVKAYAKTHGPSDLIRDWYENHGNYGMFADCANMYNAACNLGKVCSTKEECDIESVHDAKKKIFGLLDRGVSVEQIKDRVRSYWNDNTDACVGLIIDDIKKNGKPDDHVAFYGRDGKPILAKRNPSEIHEELSALNRRIAELKDGNQKTAYTDEQKERYNREIDGFRFELPKDTYTLIETGEQMAICVGGAGYRNMAQTGSAPLVVMYDKSNQKVGCIEISSFGDAINQFKAPHNGGICDENCGKGAKDAALKWIKAANLRAEDCQDVYEGFGNPNYYPYGNGDFAVVRLPANPYPEPSVVLKYYKDMERKLPSVPEVKSDEMEDTVSK